MDTIIRNWHSVVGSSLNTWAAFEQLDLVLVQKIDCKDKAASSGYPSVYLCRLLDSPTGQEVVLVSHPRMSSDQSSVCLYMDYMHDLFPGQYRFSAKCQPFSDITKCEVPYRLFALGHLYRSPVPVVELTRLASVINYTPHGRDEKIKSHQAEFWVPPNVVREDQQDSFFLNANLLLQSQNLCADEKSFTFEAKFAVAMNCFRSSPLVPIRWDDLFETEDQEHELEWVAKILRAWMETNYLATHLGCVAAVVFAVVVLYAEKFDANTRVGLAKSVGAIVDRLKSRVQQPVIVIANDAMQE